MAYNQIESKIRDWLASNLNFIEDGLKLLGKEYPLPDTFGSKGYIDLLCQDIYNNFVIVEIKRSNTSARQTITEVLKYHSLIKHNFKAREGEIRIVIISTHWNELIRAFSEIYHRTTISLKGYCIEIDPITALPYSFKLIEPLEKTSLARRFSFWQGFFLFKTIEKRRLCLDEIINRFSLIELDDFVLVAIDGPSENTKIITPYAIIIAFQKQPIAEMLRMIKVLGMESELEIMEKSDFDDELSYEEHLEETFISVLSLSNYDDAEAGYSEKFDSVLSSQGWIINEIKRYGIFSRDPRYNDDLLIKELRGHDGSSKNKFVGFAESSQMERLNEIRERCMNSLTHTPSWEKFISSLFNELEDRNEKFRILIDIYNPDSLISAFCFTMIKADPNYLPLYRIFIDYISSAKTEIYIGELYWDLSSPSSKLFGEINQNQIFDEVFSIRLSPDNEEDSRKFSLFYTNKKITIMDNKEISNEFVKADTNKIVSDNTVYKSIEEYIFFNKNKIIKMLSNYTRVVQEM